MGNLEDLKMVQTEHAFGDSRNSSPAPFISTILMFAKPARLADSALRARRPREKGFQKK